MRLAASLLVVALAACSSPAPDGGRAPYDPEDPSGPQVADLSASQFAQLRDLGVPVLVPEGVDGYRLAFFEVNQAAAASTYRLSYQRPDGACFEISGATEGLGGPAFPLVSTEVRLRDVPGQPVVRVYEAADDPLATSAQVWGVSTIVSDYVAVDGMNVLFLSDTVDGCRPVSLQEGTEIVAGLQMLTPSGAATAAPSGPDSEFAPADDVLDRYNAGSTPEVAAQSIADRYEADRVDVDVLSEADGEAVVLVTATGLADDSVRDERLRLVYRDNGVGTWELVEAGRQVRCQSGRGPQDWSAGLCQ